MTDGLPLQSPFQDVGPAATVDRCCDSAPLATASVEEREPCPAPLAWQQVLQAFRAESRPWTVEREGQALSGRTWGEGTPLYFLNGLGGTHELFALLVWLLREDFRCVLFDYSDARPASAARRPPDIENFTADLFAAADLHRDDSFQVYATSFGSMVALSAMLECPGRIERAVVQGGFAYRRIRWSERLLIRLLRMSRRTLRQVPLRETIQQQNHRVWFPPFDFTRWRFFVENTGDVPVRVLARRAGLLTHLDLRARLGEIRQPVLLVRSEGEGLVARQSHEELQVGLTTGAVEELHTCGHLPYLTHPHRLAKVVRPFLQCGEW